MASLAIGYRHHQQKKSQFPSLPPGELSHVVLSDYFSQLLTPQFWTGTMSTTSKHLLKWLQLSLELTHLMPSNTGRKKVFTAHRIFLRAIFSISRLSALKQTARPVDH